MFDKEIAIIGPTEVVKPFLTLGINCYETQDIVQVNNLLKKIVTESKVGLLFIAESLAEKCQEEIDKIKSLTLPAVFILPEFASQKRLGLKRLENVLAKAIGKKL